MNRFKVGDMVVLKSGGPKMTIQEIGEISNTEKATCFWFEGNNLKKDYFSLESLEFAN